MQFVEDYSEPQPSVFYQTPQNESIYEQRNKRFQDVYGLNDSFSSTDSVHEPLPIPLFPPPALPPKQRQLVSVCIHHQVFTPHSTILGALIGYATSEFVNPL